MSAVFLQRLLYSYGSIFPFSRTLQQRIRLEGVEKSTNVSFRVRRICGKSTILVKSGDTVIARFKRDRLAPGEMEHIALPRVLLDRAPMDEVTIEIEEA